MSRISEVYCGFALVFGLFTFISLVNQNYVYFLMNLGVCLASAHLWLKMIEREGLKELQDSLLKVNRDEP